MKFIYALGLVFLMIFGLIGPEGLFSIIPQPMGVRQWIYVVVTVVVFLTSIFLHLNHKGRWSIYLFFFTFPILAQTVHYWNISSRFFILTPVFLFLVLQLILTKGRNLPLSLHILVLFCLSTLVSVSRAGNVHNAFSFFVLGIGSFLLSAYLIYVYLRTSENPLVFIRSIVLSITLGSAVYLFIEILAFRLRPGDMINIVLRRWEQLPMGRFITGGYTEPAGLGFVFSLLFFVMALIIQNKTLPRNSVMKWVERGSILFLGFCILVVGTRSALINLIYIFIILWFLQNVFNEKRLFRIKARYLVLLGIIAVAGVYLVIPRTILTSRSTVPPSWVEPVYIHIGSRQIRVIGSTADYVKHTRASLKDFLSEPLGVGPLNATPIREVPLGGFEAGYSYSWISNLIVFGSTFGWLSLFLWVVFIAKVTYDLFRLKKAVGDSPYLSISLVFLSILLASLLPGAPVLGPWLNWSNFDRLLPLSPQTAGLPFEYPSVMSGMVLGCLVGLTQLARLSRTARVLPHPPAPMEPALSSLASIEIISETGKE